MSEVNFQVKKGLTVPRGTASTPSIIFDAGDTDTGVYSPGANQLAISTNGTQRILIEDDGDINIDSGGVFYDATNNRLAIGITSPGVALHVDGDIRCDGVYGETDTNTSIQFPGSDVITFNEGGSEAARIDSSGRLLVGTSSARTSFTNGTGLSSTVQFEATHANPGTQGRLVLSNNTTGSQAFEQIFVKSGAATTGSNALVANNDRLGLFSFQGTDGSEPVAAVSIEAYVDGTPGANDMPGRLVFSVTADGSASPTEAMRIKNSRIINIANTPVYADNAAAKTGGLVDGDVYRTSTGDLKIVYT